MAATVVVAPAGKELLFVLAIGVAVAIGVRVAMLRLATALLDDVLLHAAAKSDAATNKTIEIFLINILNPPGPQNVFFSKSVHLPTKVASIVAAFTYQKTRTPIRQKRQKMSSV